MFGYVTVYKELMKKEDYHDFCGYYCGVCKAIGKNCSHMARLGLSYDITFLAMVLSSVTGADTVMREERCIAHPIKKRRCYRRDNAVDYAADMGAMLVYLKFKDDWQDEKSIKALFGMMMFYRGMSRARKRHSREYRYIKKKISELSRLEKQNCADIDETADCFAKILEMLFAPDFITDGDTSRILKWLGYNTGRWIYIIDAVNDMERDHRRKSYNTFNVNFTGGDFVKYREEVLQNQKMTLTFTLENIASSFELLKVYKSRGVLEHIIYKSFMIKQNNILENKDGSV